MFSFIAYAPSNGAFFSNALANDMLVCTKMPPPSYSNSSNQKPNSVFIGCIGQSNYAQIGPDQTYFATDVNCRSLFFSDYLIGRDAEFEFMTLSSNLTVANLILAKQGNSASTTLSSTNANFPQIDSQLGIIKTLNSSNLSSSNLFTSNLRAIRSFQSNAAISNLEANAIAGCNITFSNTLIGPNAQFSFLVLSSNLTVANLILAQEGNSPSTTLSSSTANFPLITGQTAKIGDLSACNATISNLEANAIAACNMTFSNTLIGDIQYARQNQPCALLVPGSRTISRRT